MHPQELMRAIIDAINSHDHTKEIGTPLVNEPRQEEVIVIRDLSPDATGQTQDDPTITDTFVPPLQQKLELLKKAVDVPNIFDQDDNGVPDELDAIKKNAGVNPAVIHIASDNDPMD